MGEHMDNCYAYNLEFPLIIGCPLSSVLIAVCVESWMEVLRTAYTYSSLSLRLLLLCVIYIYYRIQLFMRVYVCVYEVTIISRYR